jgi:hypothetical protein
MQPMTVCCLRCSTNTTQDTAAHTATVIICWRAALSSIHQAEHALSSFNETYDFGDGPTDRLGRECAVVLVKHGEHVTGRA